MKPKLLAQGAEAKIYLANHDLGDTRRDEVARESQDDPKMIDASHQQFILKQRIPKSYRHPQIDKQLRTRRTKSEAKILTKARALGINVPKVIKTNKFELEIEYLKGDRLSEKLNNYPEEKQFEVLKLLGEQTALLHKNNIIHGDLTTSNVILVAKDSGMKNQNQVFLIDFGLSFISTKIEDKAVDLHLIKQALEAKHFQNHEALIKSFLEGYKFEDSKKVLERLKIVEKRGRYKH